MCVLNTLVGAYVCVIHKKPAFLQSPIFTYSFVFRIFAGKS